MVFQKGFLLRYALVFAMSLNLVTLGWAPSAHAEVVSTSRVQSVVDPGCTHRAHQQFPRAGQRARALVGLGVDPKDAQARVASLTDAELATINQRIDTLPAGGSSVLVVLGVVFVILVILELVGVINVFKNF